MTIREHKGKLAGLKLCYIGDGNNMANSLIVGGLKCGMTVSIACPDAYRPDPAVLDFAQQYPGMLQCTPDILAAAKDINEARAAKEAEAQVEARRPEKPRKGAGKRLPFSMRRDRL